MAKKFYAVCYTDGKGKIFTELTEFQKEIKKRGVMWHKGFYSFMEAKMWLENPENFPKEKTYYAVKIGKQPGIYRNLTEFYDQVNGYPNSMGKVFYTETGAMLWLKDQDIDVPVAEKARWEIMKNFLLGLVPPVLIGFYRKWQLRDMLHKVAQVSNPWVFCRIHTNHNLIIYTDASFLDGKGAGYAAVVIDSVAGTEFYVGGKSKEIDNSSRAELYAIISALRLIDKGCRASIEIRTDAHSLVMVAKPKNLRRIMKLGWDDKVSSNADLWKEYYKYTQMHSIVMNWVKGHSGNKYNVRCDKIAGRCSQL